MNKIIYKHNDVTLAESTGPTLLIPRTADTVKLCGIKFFVMSVVFEIGTDYTFVYINLRN